MAEIPDYEGYDDLVRLGRALTPDDRQFFAPPADVWSKIAGEARDDVAPVVPIADRRPRRRRWLVSAAVIGAAACAVLGLAIARSGDDVRTVEEVALTNANLDPAGASSSGQARLEVLADGSRAIQLDVRNLPQISGEFFELWLIDSQLKGMVSMGPIHGSGRYVIPAGVNTSTFPIIDLSIEPIDGVPTHSGKSVLRGVIA